MRKLLMAAFVGFGLLALAVPVQAGGFHHHNQGCRTGYYQGYRTGYGPGLYNNYYSGGIYRQPSYYRSAPAFYNQPGYFPAYPGPSYYPGVGSVGFSLNFYRSGGYRR
jgi:hypothetical protein